MSAEHHFDFVQLTEVLDYYQKIKLVNYIRKMVHNKKCPFCEKVFENVTELHGHMRDMEHCKVPEVTVFDQPE